MQKKIWRIVDRMQFWSLNVVLGSSVKDQSAEGRIKYAIAVEQFKLAQAQSKEYFHAGTV